MKKCFLALLFCFQLSFSQNVDHLNTVLKQLNLKENQVNLNLFTQKILPYDKDKSVLVIPKYNVNEQDDEGHYYFELDAYIVVINNSTGKIICKSVEPNAWSSDAYVLTGISIDTGLYLLNKTTRAFGVRVDYNASSKPNPFGETNLSLYIIDKGSLKQVLKNYKISHSSGEWDTNCAGEFKETTSAFDMDKVQNNNFNTIIVKTKIIKTISKLVEDDCISKETIKRKNSKLVFNGKVYQ